MKRKFSRILSLSLAANLLLAQVPVHAEVETVDNRESQTEATQPLTMYERALQKRAEYHALSDDYKKEIEEGENPRKTFIVSAAEGQKEAVKAAVLAIPGAKIGVEYDTLINGFSVEIDKEYVEQVRAISGVVSCKPDQKMKFNPAMMNARDVTSTDLAQAVDKVYGQKKNITADGRGLVIATLDTGVDIHHKSMRLDTDGKDTEAENKEFTPKIAPGTYGGNFTDKIPYGKNYIAIYGTDKTNTDENNLRDSRTESSHGMHIAGTIAANDTAKDIAERNGIDGIAPNAQLLVYRIYDSVDAKAFVENSSHMIKVLEDAVEHGADIITLSYGVPGMGGPSSAWYDAVRMATEKGVLVLGAMGNASTSTSTSSFDNYANKGFKQDGSVWNQADTAILDAVPAMDFTMGIGATRNGVSREHNVKIGDDNLVFAPIAENFVERYPKSTQNVDIVDAGFLTQQEVDGSNETAGYGVNLKGKNLKGKVLLVKRGYNSIYEKVELAHKLNASGIIIANSAVNHKVRDIYSTRPDYTQAKMEGKFPVWAISISGDAGEALIAKINQASGTYSTKLTFDRSVEKKDLKIGNGVAGFSQWGPTPTLRLKPEVVAPGENILSTEQGENEESRYGYQSGTSFSTPLTSGVAALAIYRQKELAPDLAGMEKTEFLKTLVMAGADPIFDDHTQGGHAEDGGKLEYSPRSQGAGMVNVDKMLSTNVIITRDNPNVTTPDDGFEPTSKWDTNGDGKIDKTHRNIPAAELGEIDKEAKFTLTLTNYSDQDVSYKIKPGKVLKETTTPVVKRYDASWSADEGAVKTETINEIHSAVAEGASITDNRKGEVTVPKNGKVTVEFTLHVAGVERNNFVEGYLYFEPTQENGESRLSVPYFGFYGDWKAEPVLDSVDKPNEPKTSVYGGTGLYVENSANATNSHGTSAKIDYKKIVPAGLNLMDGKLYPEMAALSKNTDPGTNQMVIPRFYLLRDSNGLKVDVLKEPYDTEKPLEKQEDKVLMRKFDTLGKDILQHYPRIFNSWMYEDPKYKTSVTVPSRDYGWDGTVSKAEMDKRNDSDYIDKARKHDAKDQYLHVKDGSYYVSVLVSDGINSKEMKVGQAFKVTKDNQRPKLVGDKKEAVENLAIEYAEKNIDADPELEKVANISFKAYDNMGISFVGASIDNNDLPVEVGKTEDVTVKDSDGKDVKMKATTYTIKDVPINPMTESVLKIDVRDYAGNPINTYQSSAENASDTVYMVKKLNDTAVMPDDLSELASEKYDGVLEGSVGSTITRVVGKLTVDGQIKEFKADVDKNHHFALETGKLEVNKSYSLVLEGYDAQGKLVTKTDAYPFFTDFVAPTLEIDKESYEKKTVTYTYDDVDEDDGNVDDPDNSSDDSDKDDIEEDENKEKNEADDDKIEDTVTYTYPKKIVDGHKFTVKGTVKDNRLSDGVQIEVKENAFKRNPLVKRFDVDENGHFEFEVSYNDFKSGISIRAVDKANNKSEPPFIIHKPENLEDFVNHQDGPASAPATTQSIQKVKEQVGKLIEEAAKQEVAPLSQVQTDDLREKLASSKKIHAIDNIRLLLEAYSTIQKEKAHSSQPESLDEMMDKIKALDINMRHEAYYHALNELLATKIKPATSGLDQVRLKTPQFIVGKTQNLTDLFEIPEGLKVLVKKGVDVDKKGKQTIILGLEGSSETREFEIDVVIENTVDKTALKALVDSLSNVDLTNIPAKVKDYFDTAMKRAMEVLNDAEATESDVLLAISELNKAKDSLQAQRPKQPQADTSDTSSSSELPQHSTTDTNNPASSSQSTSSSSDMTSSSQGNTIPQTSSTQPQAANTQQKGKTKGNLPSTGSKEGHGAGILAILLASLAIFLSKKKKDKN